jgi:hypothetical protein
MPHPDIAAEGVAATLIDGKNMRLWEKVREVTVYDA